MRQVQVQGRPYWRLETNEIFKELPGLLPAGNPQWVTEHWTAGPYGVGFHDYQILIADSYILVSTDFLNYAKHQHTWRRNSQNIGMAYMAMVNATERNPGPCPVTAGMMERMGIVKALLARRYGFGFSSFVDHAHWANVDGYPGQRWDNRFVLPSGHTIYSATQSKGKWYLKQITEGKIK